jgi:hypothetical protein
MVGDNLVYVFLNSAFTDCKDREQSIFTYDELPLYYTQTYEYNKQKFQNSHFILNDKNIRQLTQDKDFLVLDAIINEKWARYKKNPFWYNTSIRVILLCLYVRINNLKNVTHVEADNIIFAKNTSLLNDFFSEGEYGFCNEAPSSSAPSFIFIKDATAADNLLQKHIQLYEKGESALQPYVGHFGNYITDMALLDIIYRYRKNYKMLPNLPFGQTSENFDQLQHVFDPTSYGQHIGGTNNGHEPGFIDPMHYVGQALIHKQIKVHFDKSPFIVYQDKQIPIYNLHVHNKKAIERLINA